MGTGFVGYIGAQEIMIVGGIIVLIFGGAKIPQLAKGLGEGIREFRKSMDGTEEGDKQTPPASTATTDADAK